MYHLSCFNEKLNIKGEMAFKFLKNFEWQSMVDNRFIKKFSIYIDYNTHAPGPTYSLGPYLPQFILRSTISRNSTVTVDRSGGGV